MQLGRQSAAGYFLVLARRLIKVMGDGLHVIQHRVFFVRRPEPLIRRVHQQRFVTDKHRSAIVINDLS